jgi:hypothetical protein
MARIRIVLALAGYIVGIGASGMAQAPAKPVDILPSQSAKAERNPAVAEDRKTKAQRRADCEAQAEKLYSGQKRQFMKECMANKS